MLGNEGTTTVVVVGVTLNLAIPNTVFDLVNAGFQVVVPTDGSVATADGYADLVLAHTLAYVATLTDVATLTEAWLRA
jgi:nicotinamidase-related amidase